MKKPLFHLLRGLLLCCLTLAGVQQARASHAQAGQLTYTYVSTAANGNQNYLVRMEFYRDCSGITLSGNQTVTAVNSCGGTSITGTLLPVGQPIVGNPYCASLAAQVPCNVTGTTSPTPYPNYVTYTFEGNIALPPAAEWILSTEISNRPNVANIAGLPNLRLEARLNSLITPVGGGTPIVATNSSPAFSSTNLPVPYVYERQRTTVTFAAVDPDRTNGQPDSLVYSLDSPLSRCGTPVTYAPYPGPGCVTGFDPQCPFRAINCAAPASTYSATLPIAVLSDTVYENGSTTRPACPSSGNIVNATVRPRFSFNAQQGSFTFTPAAYQPGTSALGLNKYAVVGKVTEYRKINGHYYQVGSARRDFLVIVQQGAGNLVPADPTGTVDLPNSNVNLTLTADTTDVSITTGNYSRIRLTFTDPDNTGPAPVSPAQNLTIFTPADINTHLLQGGDIGAFVLTGNGTPAPEATFHFQPGLAAAGSTILLPMRIEDDGCAVKGVQFKAIRLHIINLPQLPRVAVAGQSTTPVRAASICPGGTLQLLSRISRPDSVRNAATGAVTAQQYAYQWASPNANPATNGLPAARNTLNLAVSPTVDTRYTLSMAPLFGFAPGQFVDTTSIVVRVQPLPAAITRTGNVLSSSISTGNQWLRNGQPIAGATGQSYTPTTAGTYTVVVTYTTGPTTCTAAASAALAFAPLGSRQTLPGTSLAVAPNPTADGRLRVELTGYAQAVSLRVYDMLGRVVQQQQVSAPNPAGTVRELDLSAQPAGVYLLQVQTRGGMDIRRIVRQ